MNKKLISLLVAICLVVGMLPIMSIAENQEAATAKIAIMKAAAANEIGAERLENVAADATNVKFLISEKEGTR